MKDIEIIKNNCEHLRKSDVTQSILLEKHSERLRDLDGRIIRCETVNFELLKKNNLRERLKEFGLIPKK